MSPRDDLFNASLAGGLNLVENIRRDEVDHVRICVEVPEKM